MTSGTIALDPERPFYTIDPGRQAAKRRSFRLAVPDFNLKSLRAERGPALRVPPGLGRLRRLDATGGRTGATRATARSAATSGDLFAAPADDVLLLKIAWWFGR